MLRKHFVLCGAKSREILAVREVIVKYGVHQRDVESYSPNGTTDTLENP